MATKTTTTTTKTVTKTKNEILKMHRKGNKFWLWHHRHDTRNSCPTNSNALLAYKYVWNMYVKTDNNLIRRLHNFPHFFFFFISCNWIFRNQKRKTRNENEREHRTQYWELMFLCMYLYTRQNIAVIHHSLSPYARLFCSLECKCVCVFSILHHHLTMEAHLAIEMWIVSAWRKENRMCVRALYSIVKKFLSHLVGIYSKIWKILRNGV